MIYFSNFIDNLADKNPLFKSIKKIPNLVLISLFSTSLLSGCSSDRLVKCAEIVNIATEMSKETQDNLANKNVKNVLAVADIFEKNSVQIKGIRIRDKQLNEYSKELSNIYQQYADSTRNFIEAFQDKDVEQALFYKEEISKLFEQQQQVVNDINQYCQP